MKRKKIVLAFLLSALLFVACFVSYKSFAYVNTVLGDCNGDGKVTLTDLTYLRNHFVKSLDLDDPIEANKAENSNSNDESSLYKKIELSDSDISVLENNFIIPQKELAQVGRRESLFLKRDSINKRINLVIRNAKKRASAEVNCADADLNLYDHDKTDGYLISQYSNVSFSDYPYYLANGNEVVAHCGNGTDGNKTLFLSSKVINEVYYTMFNERIDSSMYENEVIDDYLFSPHNYIKYDKKLDGFIFLFYKEIPNNGLPQCPIYYINRFSEAAQVHGKTILTYYSLPISCSYEVKDAFNFGGDIITYKKNKNNEITTLFFPDKTQVDIPNDDSISNNNMVYDKIYEHYKDEVMHYGFAFSKNEKGNYYFLGSY